MRILSAAAAALFLALASSTRSQEAAKPVNITLADFNGAQALILLFEITGVNYAFGESVAGVASAARISVSIRGEPVKAGTQAPGPHGECGDQG